MELNRFLKNYQRKSKINQLLTIYLEFKIMRLLCLDLCIEEMLAGKTLLVYTNSFSPNDYKKNGKIIYKCFKDKYVKS